MLNSIFNWSIVAIMASFTIMPATTGRTNVPTLEPIVEEELKGCATNFENQGLIPFHFDPTMAPTKENIEDLDNWKPGAHPTETCDEMQEVACGLLVDPDFVNSNGPQQRIDSSINLVAKTQANPLSDTYVESIAHNSGEIYNTSKP